MFKSSVIVPLIQSGIYIHIAGNPGRPHSRGGSGAGLEDKKQFATQRSRAGRERSLGEKEERTRSSKTQGEQEDGTPEELSKVFITEANIYQVLSAIHSSNWFICMNSLNPHNNILGRNFDYPHLKMGS